MSPATWPFALSDQHAPHLPSDPILASRIARYPVPLHIGMVYVTVSPQLFRLKYLCGQGHTVEKPHSLFGAGFTYFIWYERQSNQKQIQMLLVSGTTPEIPTFPYIANDMSSS